MKGIIIFKIGLILGFLIGMYISKYKIELKITEELEIDDEQD